LTPNSPLFHKERAKGGERRISPTAIQESFSEIAKDLSFIRQNGGFNPARPHSLRAAFRTMLIEMHSDDLVNFWMGHAIGTVSRAYLNMSTDKLRELYMGAEQFLKIEKTSREELSEREQGKVKFSVEVEQKIKNLETTIRTLTDQLSNVNTKVSSLEVMYNKLFELSPEELRKVLQEADRMATQKQIDEDIKQAKEEFKKAP